MVESVRTIKKIKQAVVWNKEGCGPGGVLLDRKIGEAFWGGGDI